MLSIEGEDLRTWPLEERKRRLKAVMPRMDSRLPTWIVSVGATRCSPKSGAKLLDFRLAKANLSVSFDWNRPAAAAAEMYGVLPGVVMRVGTDARRQPTAAEVFGVRAGFVNGQGPRRVIMAASDGLKVYWEALTKEPRLVVFDYLTAQRLWQKYFISRGPVRFREKPSYIAFMQAFMMAGVKGTALISFLGEIYQAASNPSATPASLAKKLARKGVLSIIEYEAQMKALEKAELGWMWLTVASSSCGPILSAMVNGEEISPSDLLI